MIKNNQIEELKKFHKSYYDVGNIQNTASELKYMNELKTLINVEFQSPTEGFVRHFAKQIYQGVLTAKIMDQFNGLTKKSIQQYINDLITERLKSALKKETRNEILTVDDIFKYAELLQKTVTNYDGEKVDKKIVSTEA